jgi:hypothetical protein
MVPVFVLETPTGLFLQFGGLLKGGHGGGQMLLVGGIFQPLDKQLRF